MTTSINTNVSAYFAQNNLRSSSAAAQSSIARLSSGNRIIRASDDVAALSIGTVLRSDVSTLRTALSNTSQASSLIQVADGALQRLGEILQRQKALAVQGNSGALSDSERGYLDLEFQSLVKEYDRIATETNFNGTSLLNGNLSDGSKIVAATDAALTASVAAAGVTYTLTANPTNGQTMLVNGATVTFTTATDRPDQVLIGTAFADTAVNLSNFLNNSSDARINQARYTVAGAAITATYAGGQSSNTVNFGFTAGTFAGATIVGTAFATTTTATGDMNARTFATGIVGDSILNNINQQGALTAANGIGVDTTALRNNPAFIGKISGFKVEFLAANSVNITLKVGNVDYTSTAVSTAALAAITMTGLNTDADFQASYGSGSFAMRTSGAVTVANQVDADKMAERLNLAFSTLDFVSNRDVASVASGSGTFTTGTTATANLNDIRVDMRSNDFTDVNIEDIKVTAPVVSGGNANIEVTIDGQRYINVNNLSDRLATNGTIILSNIDDPKKSLTIQLGATTLTGFTATAALYRTADEAATFENALKSAFGVGKGGSALQFQVGTDSDDTIAVSISGVKTTSIYKDNDGNSQVLSVATRDASITASSILDNAINNLTSVRAQVGAIQSRFNFAAATLETSVQNLDSARAGFLDADISNESTAFASQQVLIQASISVLAQANQLPQNLLKLIG